MPFGAEDRKKEQPIPIDAWIVRRILGAGFIGAAIAVYLRIFDFWSLDSAGGARAILDLAGTLAWIVVVLTLPLFWFVSAIIALWRRQFRAAVSSILAILAIPTSLALAGAIPVSDPWLWYVLLNQSRLEIVAANSRSDTDANFVVLEERDVSTGIAGVSPAHFVALIYSERRLEELAPLTPGLSHIHGHFYRRDAFM